MKNTEKMIKIYLFDWGDTLMVDFPDVPGKMCDWEVVQAVGGAKEALAHLGKTAEIYIATGAAESTEPEIQQAFERVGLDQFITGYFCKANLGVSKGTSAFLGAIVAKLGKPVSSIAMVGDSLVKDIEPAVTAGIKAIWLSNNRDCNAPDSVRVITSLRELY